MDKILTNTAQRYANGERLSFLEKETGVYRQKIIRFLKKQRIPLRGSRKFSDKQEQEIVKKYLEGRKTKYLSIKYNATSNCIGKIVKKYGKKLRPNSDECRQFKLKDNYFEKIDCEEKAYILGLLYADGCNIGDKKIALALTGNDEHKLLLKIGRLLYDGKFPLYKRKHDSWNLTIVNKKMAEALNKLGVVQRKSLILKFPTVNQVPKEFLCHFIRGYFDGDGSISLQRKKTRAIIAIIGTFKFLSSMKIFLKEFGIISNIYKVLTKSKKVFDLQFSSKNSINIFRNILYEKATMFLNRKKEKFGEIKLHENYRNYT